MTEVVAIVVFDTDNPRLTDPDRVDVSTEAATHQLRADIIAHLPQDITRIVAYMSEAEAQCMVYAHEVAMALVFPEDPAHPRHPPDTYQTPPRRGH